MIPAEFASDWMSWSSVTRARMSARSRSERARLSEKLRRHHRTEHEQLRSPVEPDHPREQHVARGGLERDDLVAEQDAGLVFENRVGSHQHDAAHRGSCSDSQTWPNSAAWMTP